MTEEQPLDLLGALQRSMARTACTPAATMLRIAGKSFRCQCGANVFTVDPVMPDWFVCNGCQTTYEGTA